MTDDGRKKKTIKPKKIGGKSDSLYVGPNVSNVWRAGTDALRISPIVSGASNVLPVTPPSINLVPSTTIHVDTRSAESIFEDQIKRNAFQLGLNASDPAVRNTLTSDLIKERRSLFDPAPQFSFLATQPDKEEDRVAILTKKMEQQETTQRADVEATKKEVSGLEATIKEVAATIDEQERVKSHFDYFKNPNHLLALLSDATFFGNSTPVTPEKFKEWFGKDAFIAKCGLCGSCLDSNKTAVSLGKLNGILEKQKRGIFSKCHNSHRLRFLVANDGIAVVVVHPAGKTP